MVLDLRPFPTRIHSMYRDNKSQLRFGLTFPPAATMKSSFEREEQTASSISMASNTMATARRQWISTLVTQAACFRDHFLLVAFQTVAGTILRLPTMERTSKDT